MYIYIYIYVPPSGHSCTTSGFSRRGTSLMRNNPSIGPYSRLTPKAISCS